MMRRRDFLQHSLVGMGAFMGAALPAVSAQDVTGTKTLAVTGSILNVHDPVMIKQDDTYYLFSTGVGIPIRSSTDLLQWKVARGSTVFQKRPEEAFAYVPNGDGIWAPDIAFYNERYHLYYSVSTFGSNRSAIGLATNVTLHSDDDHFLWVDQGIVVKSQQSNFYNAIDPNLIIDTDGTPWLAFGSHWGGIKMIQLDPATGKAAADDNTLYSLAARRVHPRAIEAPFIIHRSGYYYLFVSFDQCCQGSASNYHVRVGRSEAVTGPYIDRDGVPMMEDGGTQLTFPTTRYRGPGHNAIFRENEQDYMIYHAYDADRAGAPTLRIDPLEWDADGWCYIPGMTASE